MVLGRGTLLQKLKQSSLKNEIHSSAPENVASSDSSKKDVEHKVSATSDIKGLNFRDLSIKTQSESEYGSTSISENLSKSSNQTEPSSKEKKFSKSIDLHVNLLKIKNRNPNCPVFLFSVKFYPPIDSLGQRFKIIHHAMEQFNVPYFFSNTCIYSKEKFCSNHNSGGIIIDFIKELKAREAISVNSLALKEVFRHIGLVRLGKSFYDLSDPIEFDKYGIQVFSGYTALVSHLESGAYVCLDVANKVIRTDSVHQRLIQLFKRYCSETSKINKAVSDEIIGQTIITRYNNKTYQIIDIDWQRNPLSEFKKDDSTMISFANYFKSTYPSVNITDFEQPLLLVMSKNSNKVYLIPELCYMTGLTDSMRNDFSLMKGLAEKMKVSPSIRYSQYQKFCQLVYRSPKAHQIFDTWQLDLDQSMTKCHGKLISNIEVHFSNQSSLSSSSNNKTKSFPIQNNADFSQLIMKEKPLNPIDLKSWAIIYNKKSQSHANQLLSFIDDFSQNFQMNIMSPKKVIVQDERIEHKLDAITRLYHESSSKGDPLQIVVTFLEFRREDHYNVIKRLCYCELGIPSQIILSKTLINKNKLRSIVAKILLQINCKIGGQLWTLFKSKEIAPSKPRMICGIDVFHQHGLPSVIGLVSSLDPLHSIWYSKTSIHNQSQEISSKLEVLFGHSFEEFLKQNNCLPKELIIYRDGVGHGRYDQLIEFEVQQIRRAYTNVAKSISSKPNNNDIYNNNNDDKHSIKLTFVVVSKRINIRIFSKETPSPSVESQIITNSLPGTVIDKFVTRPNIDNFYLVPQSIRQGTATPTHYTILLNEVEIDAFDLQKLTYQLCYMYYNWPGSIRVPAPCQYAHRLAYMVGENLHKDPKKEMDKNLFYL